MQTLRSATEHYERQQRINARGLIAARRLRSDPVRLLGVVTAFQVAAAEDAAAAVPLMLEEQGIDTDMLAEPRPRALAGWSSSGWPMGTLLAKVSGPKVAPDVFDRFVLTQYQDTARQSAALTAGVTPAATGYVRMLNPPSCSRCVILAGKWYRKNQGFQRHPRCDCRHIPTSEGGRDLRLSPEDYFDSLPRAEQDRVFTKGGAEILRQAESHEQRQYLMGRLVNTRWGTRTSQRLDTKRRQMPETILARADGDRGELLRHLKAHGYIK